MLQVGRSRVPVPMRLLNFLNFFLSLQLLHDPGVYSGSNRNEYHKQKNNVPGSKARLSRKTDKLTATYETII
jgi:hypothetical protein